MEKPLLMDDDITMQDIALNFPHKLHLLLDERKYPHLLAWKEHGRAFQIIDKNLFSSEVLPQAFKRKSRPHLTLLSHSLVSLSPSLFLSLSNRIEMGKFPTTIKLLWF